MLRYDILREYFFVFNWMLVFLGYGLVKGLGFNLFTSLFIVSTIYLIRTYHVYAYLDNRQLSECQEVKTMSACIMEQQVNLNPTKVRATFNADAEWLSFRKEKCDANNKIRNTRLLNSYNPEDCQFKPCSTAIKEELMDIASEIRSYSCSEEEEKQITPAEHYYYEYISTLSGLATLGWYSFLVVLFVSVAMTASYVYENKEKIRLYGYQLLQRTSLVS